MWSKEPMNGAICAVQQPHRNETWYVSAVPGDGGQDWEYTRNLTDAASVSLHWARRFRVDCERVGRVARFYPSGLIVARVVSSVFIGPAFGGGE